MPQTIRGLPAHIATIPDDATGWLRWRESALAFRQLMHLRAEEDPEDRAAILRLCADDPAFFMLVYGCILEPRNVTDQRVVDGEVVEFTRPKGWYPWVPYPFQVELIRFIETCLDNRADASGKGDGIVEKSRDMGATWVFCQFVAHHWLFDSDFIAGLFSRKEDMVDSNDPSSMFYRIESLTGLNPKVPETCHAPGTIFDGLRVRIPDYLIPAGYEPKTHNQKLNLRHPTKTNQIVGESTTSRSGIGTRTTMNVIDEAAKIDNMLEMWSGQEAVTEHRFALSSADRRYGDGMYILANQAKIASQDPSKQGAALLTLPWNKHPLRDGDWLVKAKSRFAGDLTGFAREYEIDWDAGMGDWVYPAAKTIIATHAPYDPALGQVEGTIDPGLRDETAVAFIQYEPGTNGWHRLIEGVVLKTPSARYLAPLLMGFPRGHAVREAYPDESLQEVMDLTWELRRTGKTPRWVGDPYGDNAGGDESKSFYEALLETSRDLNTKYPDLPPVELIVITKYDEGARSHRKRKESLATKLQTLRFNDTPRCRYFLDAVKSNRYKGQDEGRLVMNEPNAPAHDWSSHPTTALEFWAVMAVVMDFQKAPMLAPSKKRKKRPSAVRPDPSGFRRIMGSV